jgi:hypothetical protein
MRYNPLLLTAKENKKMLALAKWASDLSTKAALVPWTHRQITLDALALACAERDAYRKYLANKYPLRGSNE